ncbi:hypothetical protein [Asticcacaulis sp. AC402]|uniref:hypothetical protein n=1 Tax=Asticcacaulis sp. AC402 TaxID=1282361 RepID=UPI0003C3C1DF|nr:hypothetical protein [Asticcacaulis sp. AC402]ESQ75513.1 hypothetical protein ABAC402_08285 [Asticcacaulis sp. AC402]
MSKLPVFAGLLLGAACLVQCSPKPAADAVAASSQTADFSYDVLITLTPAAEARLKTRGEKLTVETLYYGNVTPATAAMADPKDGTLHLNTDRVTVEPASQTVRMSGVGVDPVKLAYITQQKPLALINVYASKDGNKVATIACDVFQDYVAVAQEKPVKVNCDLK